MKVFVRTLRKDFADGLRTKALKTRTMHHVSRERFVRELMEGKPGATREQAIDHLQGSWFWRSGETGLAFADLLDSLARTIEP